MYKWLAITMCKKHLEKSKILNKLLKGYSIVVFSIIDILQ